MPKLTKAERHPVRFTLNGRPVETWAEPRTLLTDVLRHGLGSTGTHVGCEHGVCGACTVEIDGEPARACLVLAGQVDGQAVRTVEGLEPEAGRLSVLQEAFRRHHGLQCGFCTPGILMTLDGLFRARPDADEAEIRDHLSGHLCRCTGYAPIMRAALDARDRLNQARREETHA
ncbi:(2Fe-2S)-binding protein [Aureimonas phyllosphaerae]|uniref:2-furoyl-CoA dehydrogenase 2Fe-2S iron sulfur subunit n=1 Tax=Aureimonas phyllosphaerae TaxID=1166078 RepID=A0A7W6BX24_9HYPH|nr:(2Fe-2S)-binding protein [Aureimonas phyllosphaerae]MBB3937970.1 2-furoyl-CoA dehydrogenase 2Fe-2S iron sulfur subunit [Aureimonas phyllosphaerae]MBB3961985.1 2-furoyl-CoA dehydrogenase 2Fe-2S iron sulfur subunit [Aureimonas phyllosphaerae]SFF52760.1 2-furoyl-CoA dehydrogenase 2Fe-2S iron sulfur subunit [Aureimonas phyllosphaerae]